MPTSEKLFHLNCIRLIKKWLLGVKEDQKFLVNADQKKNILILSRQREKSNREQCTETQVNQQVN